MKLNDAQKQAVEYLDGPLLVLAGPGTGKTQLLSSRVAYILQNTDTSPENILCITFTENGAINMRERLNSIIGKDSRKINIHTYHAFGSDILAQYKNYAESFDRILDSPIDSVNQFKIIKNIQSELPALDILKNASPNDIASTISSAKSARLSANDLALIASVNTEESAVLSSEISPILEKLVPRMKLDLALAEVYQPIAEILARHSETQPIVGNIDHIVKTLALDLVDAITEATESGKITPLTSWKTKHFEKSSDGSFRLKDHIANKKLASLANIMSAYQTHLEENGLFDFADMIEEAISVLKSDAGFRLTLSEKYQYILLDEFQDTNPSQFEIIKLLTEANENPDIMAVGDDDQAIFEFQGANASNLSIFKDFYSAHVINLTENYRSTSEILDFSRRIATQIPDSFEKKHGIKKLLHSFRSAVQNSETTPVKSKVERHEFITAEAEYYWVATQISDLIKSGVPQDSIAIITPKHKYITPLLPYLKSHKNINIAYEKKENLLEDLKIHELTTLARFVHELATGKAPAHRLYEILSYPFWGISPVSVIKSIEAARGAKKSTLDYLLESSDEKLQSTAQFLAALAVRSHDAPLELFIDYLTGTAPLEEPDFRSPFLEFYAKNSDSYLTFELYENLSVIKEKIKSHTRATNPKLRDFISFLDDYEDANAALINTSPYQDSSSAVQILTAHSSKGLEFEHVFLIATDNISWGKGKGNNNLLSLPKNLIQIRHTGVTDSERLRLFFVALTRAKTYLTLTNSIKDFSGKTPERLDYLAEYVDNDTKSVISPYLPESSRNVTCHYEDLDEAKKQTDLRSNWISAYHKLTPELRPILLKRLENYALTASDLTSFIDIAYAGPLSFYREKILRAPRESETRQIILGNLIHATFERLTRDKISDEAALEFFRTEALKSPLEEKDIKELLEIGAYSLDVSLKTFGELLRTTNSRAEVDLYHEHLSLDNVPITGKIDHISIDEENKTIEIYDFKTSKFRSGKWESDRTLFKYSLQLGFYKLLLDASPTYSKYYITTAHILFVSPDEEGKVHDRSFDLTDDFMDYLKNLARSIYAHIKSLNFVEDPELMIESDNSKETKDIKAFIELVLAKTPKIS